MTGNVEILTLIQWARGANWRLELQHSSPAHALVWITKGQARATIDGIMRGVGVHNVLAIPAGTLMSIQPGAQCFGLVCLIPPNSPVLMPDTAQHLRIRDVQPQAELTAILDAMQREANQPRPFGDEALYAHATLMTVWLRRAMIAHEVPPPPTAAERLVTAFCALVEQEYRSGRPMADYARDLGVTPTHLTRCCRQCSGLTAADILTQRTLHAAREMLTGSRDAIRHVAAQLGFRSAAYFSRFILHHTGCSPSDLRRNARKERPHG